MVECVSPCDWWHECGHDGGDRENDDNNDDDDGWWNNDDQWGDDNAGDDNAGEESRDVARSELRRREMLRDANIEKILNIEKARHVKNYQTNPTVYPNDTLCGCTKERILSICNNEENDIERKRSDSGCNHDQLGKRWNSVSVTPTRPPVAGTCNQSPGWFILAAEYLTVLMNTRNSGCGIPNPGCNIADAAYQAQHCLEQCTYALSAECIELIRILDQWNDGDCEYGPDICRNFTTPTRTPSSSPGSSPSVSKSPSASRTPTPSISATRTPTPSISQTRTPSPSAVCRVTCVYSQGYWKNHEENPVWDEVEGLEFCGCTYKMILGVDDKKRTNNHNNCDDRVHWINLARQYVAAHLNSLNFNCSAPYPKASDTSAFYAAQEALEDCDTNDPNWSILTRILDEWNNGDCSGGPPHCDNTNSTNTGSGNGATVGNTDSIHNDGNTRSGGGRTKGWAHGSDNKEEKEKRGKGTGGHA